MSTIDISTLSRWRFLQNPGSRPLKYVLISRAHRVVREQYEICVSEFETALSHFVLNNDLQEIFDNFTFWGVEYGAYNGSLDKSLDKSTSLATFVMQTLEAIRIALGDIKKADSVSPTKEGQPSMNDDAELSRIHLTLNDLINHLYDLAPSLVSPAPLDDINQRGTGFLDRLDSDIQQVKALFPAVDDTLASRLGTANWLRRNRLFAWRTEYELLTKRGKYTDENMESDDDDNVGYDNSGDNPILETYLDAPFDWIKLQPSQDDDASSAASSKYQRHDPSFVDPDPVGNWRTAKSFECYLCFQFLTQVHTDAEWRQHVMRDLEPYMCTIGDCSQAFRNFRLRKDWWSHEEIHRTSPFWKCSYENLEFYRFKEFEAHMQFSHKQSVQETDCVQGTNNQAALLRRCLLCHEHVEDNLQKHVAAHLEKLAVFALPGQDQIWETMSPMIANDAQKIDEQSSSKPEKMEPKRPDQHRKERSPLKPYRKYENAADVPFRVVATLGAGASGRVYKVQHIKSGQFYAQETMWTSDRRQLDLIAKEVEILRRLQRLQRLNHEHFVAFVDAYKLDDSFCIIISPVADFDLSVLLSDIWPEWSFKKKAREWFGDLACGLNYLHENQIRHRDIKPSNLLVKGTRIMYSGFGIAIFESNNSDSSTESLVGTRVYEPPEFLRSNRRNCSADIWALGCVFLEMQTVFCGKAIEELREFMRRDDTYSAAYASNLEKIPEWISIQRSFSPGTLEVERPLEWVGMMLCARPGDRITARRLQEEIRGASSPEFRFIGDCRKEGSPTSGPQFGEENMLIKPIEPSVDTIEKSLDLASALQPKPPSPSPIYSTGHFEDASK